MELSDIGPIMFASEVNAKNCSETPQKMTFSSGSDVNNMWAPRGILGIFGESLFIFRELGSTSNYFRGAGEKIFDFCTNIHIGIDVGKNYGDSFGLLLIYYP